MKYLHELTDVKIVLSRMLCLLAGFVLFFFCMPRAHAQVLWSADTSRGTNVFESLEEAPGTIGLAQDPKGQFGMVYKYSTFDDSAFAKERAESKGTVTPTGDFRVALGGTYFIGWREMWNPMPIKGGAWVAFWQMHGYGPPGQGAPLVLRTVNDGNLHLQNNVNGTNVNFWTTKFPLGIWSKFVVEVHLATDNTGWVQLWYNGVPQTFINGKTRFNCPTWDAKKGSFVEFKWGVYRSGSMNGKGAASTYMSGAKIGVTYADVAP